MSADKVFYTISEQIVHQIKNDIFSGELKVGENLREAPMAEKYNVSRGPVRDALKVLAKEGFLIAKPNVGVTVAPPPGNEVMQLIISLRRQLEKFALEKTIHQFKAEDFRQLEIALQKMNGAVLDENANALLNYDISFHSVIMKKYADRHLYGIWNDLVFRMMFNYDRLANLQESCEEHSAILRAIQAKNLAEALSLLENNIQ